MLHRKESDQRGVFPRRSAIVGMSDRRFFVVIENLSRNEHNQNRSVLYYLINSQASSAILFASSIQLRRDRFLLMLNFTFDVKTMADVANKYPENVAGKFYVDDQCIDCDLCRETAPANFKRNDDGGHSYVYKQPETPDEEGLCKEAMEGCPVEAIGNDGNGA